LAVEARCKHWTSCETMRKLFAEGQCKHGVTRHCKHFKANIDVIEEMWGPLSPTALATGGVTETEEQNRLIACMFLMGGSARTGHLMSDLNENFMGGNDAHPKSLEHAVS